MNEIQKAISELLKPYLVEGQTDYDITAVLKYIYKKGIYDEIISEMFIRFQTMKNINGGDTIFIPNKPLHLYTEQEEILLLDLLLKLK